MWIYNHLKSVITTAQVDIVYGLKLWCWLED